MNTENITGRSFTAEMPQENICMFAVGEQNGREGVSVSRFIYETSPHTLGGEIMYPAFGCHLVTGGSAVLHSESCEERISTGDVFFAFPMIPFSLSDIDELKYIYINFVGNGVGDMLSSLGIGRGRSVREGMDEMIDIWFHALGRCNSENLSMLGVGLLYHTLAMLPTDTHQPMRRKEEDIALKMKKAADMCYQNEDLSIDYLARQYRYNGKYLSRKFSEAFGVSFSDYLRDCRINRACILLSDSDMTVQEIATSVGYHDPLYFSKVFRRQMKQSPTEYRREVSKQKIPE